MLEGLDSFETYTAIWPEVSEMTSFPVGRSGFPPGRVMAKQVGVPDVGRCRNSEREVIGNLYRVNPRDVPDNIVGNAFCFHPSSDFL